MKACHKSWLHWVLLLQSLTLNFLRETEILIYQCFPLMFRSLMLCLPQLLQIVLLRLTGSCLLINTLLYPYGEDHTRFFLKIIFLHLCCREISDHSCPDTVTISSAETGGNCSRNLSSRLLTKRVVQCREGRVSFIDAAHGIDYLLHPMETVIFEFFCS